MRHTVMVVLCCLLGVVAAAQETALTTEQDARALAEATLARVIAGEYQAAFDDLRPVWPFSPGELDTLLSTTVNQRATVAERFRESLGSTLGSRGWFAAAAHVHGADRAVRPAVGLLVL